MGIMRTIFTFILVAVLVFLCYQLYILLPGGVKNFNIVYGNVESLPDINASSEIKQFYPNMRFAQSHVSYNFSSDCTQEKKDRMIEAINYLDANTSLTFKQLTNADINILCSDQNKEISKNTFIAGEGGPSQFLNTTVYPLIIKGEILLYDSKGKKCSFPVVELHELLHVFGFDHNNKKTSILYPYSSCDQVLDEEIISEINRIYAIEPKADLVFDKAEVSSAGSYINFEVSVGNKGLIYAKNVFLEVYAGDKKLKDFDLEDVEVGTFQTLTVSNLLSGSRNIASVKLILRTDTKEYNLANNEVIANLN